MNKNNSIRKGLAVAIILLFIGVSVIPSTGTNVVEKISTISTFYDGNILYVGGNGTGNYTKIQGAINDANNGDTVFVYDDSSPYYEYVNVNKMINLIGEDRNTTIIDCGGDDNVVDISANRVNISGFTIRNSGTAQYESGIKMDNQNNITISGNILFDNNVGIFLDDTVDSFISDNIIIGNRDNGIYFDGESRNNNATNNIITENPNGILTHHKTAQTFITGNFIDKNSRLMSVNYRIV